MTSYLEIADDALRRFNHANAKKAKNANESSINQSVSSLSSLNSHSHYKLGHFPPRPSVALASSDSDDLVERAAIVEHDAGIPRLWAEGYTRLLTMPMPAGFTVDQWQDVIDACGRVLDGWAARLAALGWTTLDLFGCQRGAPRWRFDGAGLVLLLPGSEIVAVTAGTVKLRTRAGTIQTFYRCGNGPRRVLLWELA